MFFFSPEVMMAGEVFKQGAEAKLYTGEFLGKKVIIKQRFAKKYRHPDLDALLTKERTKTEAKYLVKCRKIGTLFPNCFMFFAMAFCCSTCNN